MPFSDDFEKLLQSLKQMDVDRKLREELRMDSQRLHEEFREEYRKRRKRPYGESHPYNAFIPKRFEDLKLNGGTRFKRILIKQNYHRSRFKDLNSKPPRRALDFKGSLDLTGLATSQRRCVRMKTIGMKKQYNREKKAILLAQACKSLGVFCESSGCKDTKNDLQICVGTRQIVDTGVKRDEHHFGDGFTSYAPMDIECQVDTLIGDQSIFAEEVKVRDAADPDAAMESSQDVTSMESVSEETSKHKNLIELSQVHQKWGKRGFHKVRFKFILHQRSKVAAEKVTKGEELFKLENSKSLNKGRSRNLTVRWYYYKARKRKQKFYGMGRGSNSFDGLINGKDEGAHFSKKKSLVETGKRCETRFFGFGTPQ